MNRFLFWSLLLLLSWSCTKQTTTLVDTWSDTDYPAQGIDKFLVVGTSPNRLVRKTFEVAMRDRLNRQSGIEAMASLEAISTEEEISTATFEQYFKDSGIDAVLVTRVVDAKEAAKFKKGDKHQQLNPYYNDFFSYYRRMIVKVPEPGTFNYGKMVQLETNVFETEEGKLIWRALSQSYDEGNTEKVIDDLTKLILKQMKEDGVIR